MWTSDFPSAACQQVKDHCNNLHIWGKSLPLLSLTKATVQENKMCQRTARIFLCSGSVAQDRVKRCHHQRPHCEVNYRSGGKLADGAYFEQKSAIKNVSITLVKHLKHSLQRK